MSENLPADYLVIGAGASAMAFVDALVEVADVHVVMVDRRHAPGGHWLQAYPFVRLHQASTFYGVSSTLLGSGATQERGPEKGLHERASAPEICAYYARVMDRLVATGRVEFFPGCEYLGDRTFRSLISGRHYAVSEGSRLVDAHYLAPDIPATTPAPFSVADGVRVIPVNGLVGVTDAPRQFVVAGSGKTATDACIWLLSRGVDPDAISWVRPREPWMLNRAMVQPDPVTFFMLGARVMAAAAAADSPEDLFLRLEQAGVMLRIDRSVPATMAKTPTIAQWEIDLLRTIENVVRLGHIRAVEPERLRLVDGDVRIRRDALVVHCAASGLKYPPLVPIWSPQAITLQPVRPGFPLFGAALIGYIEATRDDDAEKNRVCHASPLPDTPASWARMQLVGGHASAAFAGEPDIKDWADRTTLNPGRITPEQAGDPQVVDALERFKAVRTAGTAGLERLAAVS